MRWSFVIAMKQTVNFNNQFVVYLLGVTSLHPFLSCSLVRNEDDRFADLWYMGAVPVLLNEDARVMMTDGRDCGGMQDVVRFRGTLFVSISSSFCSDIWWRDGYDDGRGGRWCACDGGRKEGKCDCVYWSRSRMKRSSEEGWGATTPTTSCGCDGGTQ